MMTCSGNIINKKQELLPVTQSRQRLSALLSLEVRLTTTVKMARKTHYLLAPSRL
jgi:hypothetical protein